MFTPRQESREISRDPMTQPRIPTREGDLS